MLERYEVWARPREGWGTDTGIYMGTAQGNSFEDACERYIAPLDPEYYDAERNMYCKCELFSSKEEAKRP